MPHASRFITAIIYRSRYLLPDQPRPPKVGVPLKRRRLVCSESVRALYLLVFFALFSCGPPAPATKKQPPPDPTTDPSYARTVDELVDIDRRARESFRAGKGDQAASLIESGEPLSKRLLSVPAPTLAAIEAASDLDQLYGDMLLSNHNYGWARLLYQKNLARWKYQRPQTPETEVRRKQAESAIAECDRRLSGGR